MSEVKLDESAKQAAQRADAIRIRKELALAFRGRAIAQEWKPKSAAFNKNAFEFLLGARAALELVEPGRGERALSNMLLAVLSVRPIDDEFARWIKTANELLAEPPIVPKEAA